ncbi:phosphatase PAP2 family protein [Parasphingorhabdus pacifica]
MGTERQTDEIQEDGMAPPAGARTELVQASTESTSVSADLRVVSQRWPWLPAVFGLVLSTLCAFGFAGLAEQVFEQGPLVGLDRRLAEMAGPLRSPGGLEVFAVVTWLGDSLVVTPVALVAGIALVRVFRSWAPLVLLLLASIGTAATVELIKLTVARPRPPALPMVAMEDGFGFPSGHAAHSAAVYLMVACLLTQVLSVRWQRIGVVLVVMLLIAVTMCSRVVLGVHSPSDVLAGLLLGIGLTTALLSVYRLRLPARRMLADLARR